MLENPHAKNMQLNEVKSYFTKLNVCRILATNILHNIFHNTNGQWKINVQLCFPVSSVNKRRKEKIKLIQTRNVKGAEPANAN